MPARSRERGLIVARLTLTDFRSYPTLDLGLPPGLVLAVGANGAGKTNLLEAVHVATQGVSPRTRDDANLARFGCDRYAAGVEGESDRGPTAIEVRWHAGEGKRVRVNNAPLTSLDRLRSDTATLVFTPDRLAVVKAGPAVRRFYIDRVIGRTHPARATLPTEYASTLAQRNAALRRFGEGVVGIDAVGPWTERLVEAGAALVSARLATIEALTPPFAERAGELGLADARLRYEPSRPTTDELEARLARDVRRGTTSVGPHLDEIRILAGDRELRSHGSQGEQRVAVLALLLAEAELLAETRRVRPLLLLDDVLSELDGDRRSALVERLRVNGQVLVTATARGALPGDADATIAVTPGVARVA